MRAVHAGRRVKGRILIIRAGRDDQPFVLPVVKVFGSIGAHAPVPDAVFAICFFLIFPVKIVSAINVDDRPAVSLDPLSFCIEPYLAGMKTVVHFVLLQKFE